jgi:hypothetical protein
MEIKMTDRFTHGWDKKRYKGKRLGTLWSRRIDPDGDISLSEEFDEYSDISKLDILGDWIGLLKREYNIVYKNLYKTEKDTDLSKLLSHQYEE